MRRQDVPSFAWPGGKSLLSQIIVEHAPKRGRKFIDVFGGRGNVFFRAASLGLNYEEWVLNDPLTAPFFRAIREFGNTASVPKRSTEEFKRQRQLAEEGNPRAILLAPYFCFNGGTYDCGGSRTEGGRRTPESYRRNLRLAHRVMASTKPRITALDWLDCLEAEQLGSDDFVFFDAPYLDSEPGPYTPDSIIPAELIAYLKAARFKWIFCEYRQPIYEYAFGKPFYIADMQVRCTNFNNAPQEWQKHCLWTNVESGGTATLTNRCSATVRVGAHKNYKAIPMDELLREIADAKKTIEANQIKTSAEIRRRLLPALSALKARLKRKKPGYYETLEKMGISPSTMRCWFNRGRHTAKVIQMLEKQPNTPVRKGRSGSDDELRDEKDLLLLHADKMAAALLGGKLDFARRLASEYANVRRLEIKSGK